MKTDTPSLRTKLTKNKAVRKLEADIAEAQLALSELQMEKVKAVRAFNDSEAAGVNGPELLEVRFHQKKRAIKEAREHMKSLAEQHKAAKELLKTYYLELENIDIEAAEEMLPILLASNKAPAAERWRGAPIDHLLQYGLAQSVVDKVRAGGVETLGDLAKKKSVPTFTCQDLNISEGDCDKVDTALAEFLEAYASFTQDMENPAEPAVVEETEEEVV